MRSLILLAALLAGCYEQEPVVRLDCTGWQQHTQYQVVSEKVIGEMGSNHSTCTKYEYTE